MRRKLIAIDPGTDKSGVAIFQAGELVDLKTLALPELVEFIRSTSAHYVIEDVEANKFIYSRNQKANARTAAKVAQSVGLVKATARHIMSFMDWHGREYTPIKPAGGNWGTINTDQGKRALAQRLNWTATSNKDTRSAAFLGYLYLQTRYREAQTRQVAL